MSQYAAQDTFDLIKNLQVEFAFAITNSCILNNLIKVFHKGIWNAHPGSVLDFMGFDATSRMILKGFIPMVTVHLVDDLIDTGQILLAKNVFGKGNKNIQLQKNNYILFKQN